MRIDDPDIEPNDRFIPLLSEEDAAAFEASIRETLKDREPPVPQIRPIAICVLRRGNQILVMEVPDVVKGTMGYRPLGGGIEYGEYTRDAVQREIREELGVEITDVVHLGTTENIFTHMGALGHEVVFVYEGRFPEAGLYESDFVQGVESDGGLIRAVWKSLDDFAREPLYPNGLLELLSERWGL